ncbi:MAG: CRISPR-associated endonuclease Cas1 [Myxococcales bacterium]|nr:CRISPR-associated endonuclease Cas1 [Myxococcales bacterium]
MSGARTVYVARKGATLRRDGARLTVVSRQDAPVPVTVHDLGQLVLMGNVTLTPAALEMLLREGVDTVLLSWSGRYRGRIVGGPSRNVALRVAQYRALDDPARACALAKDVVAGKVCNQRVLLQRHARRHSKTDALDLGIRAMRASQLRLERLGDLDQVRGCEGAAAAAYFRAFDDLIRAPGFRFDGRNRRPPLDPVNVLLSLGYTLLSNAVEAAVHVVGLDPYLGALHANTAGRPSLVCDLVEELRAPIVDALVVAALNKGAFSPRDFEDTGPGEPVRITPHAMRWFVTLFERRLVRPTWYEPAGCKRTVRDIIEAQARAFARAIVGEADRYDPYLTR